MMRDGSNTTILPTYSLAVMKPKKPGLPWILHIHLLQLLLPRLLFINNVIVLRSNKKNNNNKIIIIIING